MPMPDCRSSSIAGTRSSSVVTRAFIAADRGSSIPNKRRDRDRAQGATDYAVDRAFVNPAFVAMRVWPARPWAAVNSPAPGSPVAVSLCGGDLLWGCLFGWLVSDLVEVLAVDVGECDAVGGVGDDEV
jgi:hypothetical protein